MKPDNLIKALKQKSNQELRELLEAAYDRIAQLESLAKAQQKSVRKLKTVAAKTRQQVKSLQGQLKAEQAKIVSLKKIIAAQKVKVKQARVKQKAAETEVKIVKNILKEIKPKLSKEQVFEIYRQTNLDRFWERVTQVQQISPEKLVEMREKMATWDSQKLRDIIRIAGWRSTWYDSDAEWNSSEIAAWDERNLYAFIMSY